MAANGPLTVMGIELAHPVGVAAGYDRDGSRLAELAAAGFAFVEVGTINAPGAVARAAANHLACHRRQSAQRSGGGGAAIGVSIGSRRDAPDADAADEIVAVLHALSPLADYLVVNLSRPGSACRDRMAGAQPLRALLERLRAQVDATSRMLGRRIPLLVKVAVLPEDTEPVPEAARLAALLGYEGVVMAFEHWPSAESVCGRISTLRARLRGTALIAVGGVRTAGIARRYLHAGADLVEIYTAVAESGPPVAGELVALGVGAIA